MIRQPRVFAAAAACMALLFAACESATDNNGAAGPASLEHAGASSEHVDEVAGSGTAAGMPGERAVVAETLPYVEIDDALVYGHFVFPEDMDKPLPAIIVMHEWWGLNEGVRAMADRIAAQGYIVLAIDLFGGQTALSPIVARKLMISVVENPDKANINIRSAYEFLDEVAGAPKIASIGWGFGGGWTLNAAMLYPEGLDSAVIFYGQVTDDHDLLRPLNVPILGLFAEKDRRIPVDSVRAFEGALENLRKDYEIEVYPGVGHAFANPLGTRYDESTAELAWQRTLEFLERHLGE